MRRFLAAIFVLSAVFTVSPFSAFGLTFTLSDDAILSLDYAYKACGDSSATITGITDVEGPGVRFDIRFDDPLGSSGKYPTLYWTSNPISGALIGRDLSMLDAFALKFTLLSANGVSSPDAIGPVIVGALITHGDYLYAYRPEVIAFNDSYDPAIATSVTTTDGADKIELIGFTCNIPYWRYDEGYPSPWDSQGANISLLVEPVQGAVVVTSDPFAVLRLITIDKCKITAGKTNASDSISVSGRINPWSTDLLSGKIEVNIFSDGIPVPCSITFPIDNIENVYEKEKFRYSGTENGVRKSFKLDLYANNKFAFTVKNINLSGLTCPLNVRIDIGDYNAQTELDETVVNGPKKPIPINFLMGVKDSLRVDKIKVKQGKTDTLSVKGAFSVDEDVIVNLFDYDLSVWLNSDKFIIPANSFKEKNGKFACSKVPLYDGPDLIGFASAVFDFNKCSFTLTIKNAKINTNPGDSAQFTIEFGGFDQAVDVTIP